LVAEAVAIEEKHKVGKRSVLDDASTHVLANAKPLMLTNDEANTERVARKYDDRDDEEEDSDLDSSDSDDDDDLEEELLQRELEKIKKEREEARLRKEAEESESSLRSKSDAAMASNPLLAKSSQQIKRKWNDDVVFKNQARSEPEIKKRFVNDTIRNDFHRRFLSKYMK
jgi:protein CWC15